MKKSTKPITYYLNDFLDWLDIEKGLSSKSQENYKRFLSKFLNWLEKNNLKDLKPHQLSPTHIWDYRVYLSRQCLSHYKTPLKKSTQNYYLIALRSLLNYFANCNIRSLPAEKIKLAKDKKERKVKFLNLEQLQKIFLIPDAQSPIGLRDRTILETLFSTGLRIGELVSLDTSQLDFNLIDNDLEISIVGKGGRPRAVYFSQKTVKWLKRYLKTRQDNEKALFINYRKRKDAPRRLSIRSMEKIIKKYALLAGLSSHITPHTIRHTFATDLLNQGVDLRLIQEFLGHKNISTTQIYTHVTNKQLREVHRKYHS